MVVEREVYRVKQGCMDKLVGLLEEEIPKRGHDDPTTHLYTPEISPGSVIVIVWEFESLAAREAYWKEVAALPGVSGFMEKSRTYSDGKSKTEIWNLAATW